MIINNQSSQLIPVSPHHNNECKCIECIFTADCRSAQNGTIESDCCTECININNSKGNQYERINKIGSHATIHGHYKCLLAVYSTLTKLNEYFKKETNMLWLHIFILALESDQVKCAQFAIYVMRQHYINSHHGYCLPLPPWMVKMLIEHNHKNIIDGAIKTGCYSTFDENGAIENNTFHCKYPNN